MDSIDLDVDFDVIEGQNGSADNNNSTVDVESASASADGEGDIDAVSVDGDEMTALDFASQLRKHRREVLQDATPPSKKKADFAATLSKHREHLVEAWEKTQASKSNITETVTSEPSSEKDDDAVARIEHDGDGLVVDIETDGGSANNDDDASKDIGAADGGYTAENIVTNDNIDGAIQQQQQVEVTDIGDDDDDFGTFENAAASSTEEYFDDGHVNDFLSEDHEQLPSMNGAISQQHESTDSAADVSLSFDNPFADEIAQGVGHEPNDNVKETIEGSNKESSPMPFSHDDDDARLNDAPIDCSLEPTNETGMIDILPITDFMADEKETDIGGKDLSSAVQHSDSSANFQTGSESAVPTTNSVNTPIDSTAPVVGDEDKLGGLLKGDIQPSTNDISNDDTFIDAIPSQASNTSSLDEPDKNQGDPTNEATSEDVGPFAAVDLAKTPVIDETEVADVSLDIRPSSDLNESVNGRIINEGTNEGIEALPSVDADVLMPDMQDTKETLPACRSSAHTSNVGSTMQAEEKLEDTTEPANGIENIPDDSDEDFGDFEGIGPAEHAEATPEEATKGDTPIPTPDATGEADDGWGTFDSAETSDALPTLATNDDSEEADDDWGDFGTAGQSSTNEESGSSLRATHSAEDTAKEDTPLPTPDATGEADDGWGTFDLAETSDALPTPTTNDDADEADDDWGDFGTAGQSSPNESELPPTNTKATGEAVDDWGTFDSAVISGAEQGNDWGDFGSADHSALEDEEQPDKGSDPVADKEYSDFNSAAFSGEDNNEDEQFGDFSDLPASSPEEIVSIPPIGDIGDKARDFFTKMKMKYCPQGNSNDVNLKDDVSFVAETTLQSIISSLRVSPSVQDGADAIRLHAVALGNERDTKQDRLLIEGDGSGPYGIFMYPLGGLHSPKKKVRTERERRASSLRLQRVPDILPIQLPTGNEMPLNVSSPISRQKKFPTKSGGALGEGIPFPNLKATEAKLMRDEVEELKASIPDLSFMLQSTLSLPTK